MGSTPTGPRLLTPGEVASLFRVDPKTVSRWAASGRISSIKTPGGHARFRESEVQALLEGGASGGHGLLEHSEQRATSVQGGNAGYWCNRCAVLVGAQGLTEHNASETHRSAPPRPLAMSAHR